MEPDALRSLERDLAQRAARGLGDVERASGRILQPFSIAGRQAAENLLGKARRALGGGDPVRARALVDRAVQLPFDAHEEAAPVAMTAHMELFDLLTDALEDAEADDSRWLDAALDVLATADASARCEIRDLLVAIEQDYEVSAAERSRIRSAVATIPDRAELIDLDLGATELGDLVMSILAACNEYQSALEARA